METKMTVYEKEMTAVDVRKQVNLIQDVMQSVMKKDEHYGIVPGCGEKPALLKAGAEKIAMTFRLAAGYDELPGSAESDAFIVYKIKCTLTHIPTGLIVGSAVGTCNSKEKKYRTRMVYENKATEEEKAIGKPEERHTQYGKKKVFIVPQNPWDLQNTIYKMACKRALVAAVLTSTAASDFFTQDIEDLPEGTVIQDEKEPAGKPVVEAPKSLSYAERFTKAKEKLGDEEFFKIIGAEGFTAIEEIPDTKAELILTTMFNLHKAKAAKKGQK